MSHLETGSRIDAKRSSLTSTSGGKNQEVYLGVEVHFEEREAPAPHQTLQPTFLVQARKTSGDCS